jgi:hypothetical protein
MGRLIRSTTTDGFTGKHAIYWQGDDGLRHWVSDEPTLTSLGGWAAVQVLPNEDVTSIPVGFSQPSVEGKPGINNTGVPEQALVRGSPRDPKVYFTSSGERHWIHDPDSFEYYFHSPAYSRWDDIAQIHPQELVKIQEGGSYWMPDGPPL